MNVIIAWLIGTALSLMIKSITMINDVQSNTIFIAELSKNILPGQRITAESLVADLPQIQKKSVEMISAQRALQTMKSDMPELEYLSDNPFRDIITFQTKGLSNAGIPQLVSELKDIQGIESVYYDEELIESLPGSLYRIQTGFFVISLLVFLGSLIALILRIIRDLRTYKQDITIMILAGSHDSAILEDRRGWSIKWGSWSALIAAIFMVINILFINQTLLHDLEITFLQSLMAIGFMIVIVIMLHAVTTHLTIKSYLAQLNPNIKS